MLLIPIYVIVTSGLNRKDTPSPTQKEKHSGHIRGLRI